MLLIEDYIPEGYENRVSRDYLKSILHIPDREIREKIAEAAERGCLIASDGGGYFRRKDEKDDPHIQAYILREDRRFRTQSHKNKLMRLAWERIHPEQKKTQQVPGQMSLFEV